MFDQEVFFGCMIFRRVCNPSQSVWRAFACVKDTLFCIFERRIKGVSEERGSVLVENGGEGWFAHEGA